MVVTSGGDNGTSGAQRGALRLRDPRALTALAFLLFGLLYMAVNAASMIDQRRALGRPIDAWQAWTLESTSLIAWLLLLPVVLAISTRLLRRPFWQTALGHLGAVVAVSCAHTLVMTGMRIAAYALVGQDYAPSEPWSDRLLFEARKDLITYVSILAVFLLARRLVTSPLSPSRDSPEQAATIEVRDGSRLVLLRPEEIEWVSAAGNYVELHGAFGSELARRTMANLEQELAPHGFIRVHRSRLVRRGAIQSAETRQSGDFDITLRSGTIISGSRRFRKDLA